MTSVPTAPEDGARAARIFGYGVLALNLAAASIMLSIRHVSAPPVHAQVRHIAAVEAAHEAAIDALKATEAFVRRQRAWPHSLTQTGHAPVLPAAIAAIDIPAGTGQVISVRFNAPYAAYSLQYIRMAEVGRIDGDWACDAAGMPIAAVPPDCHSSGVEAGM